MGLIGDKYWAANGVYPENIHLATLYVRPEAQGQGIGSELVNWGFRVAEKEQMVIGVEAVGKPKPFYEKLGFKALDTIVIRAADDNESVALHVLVYCPKQLQASLEGTLM